MTRSLSLGTRVSTFNAVVGQTRLTMIEIDALNFFQLENLISR